MDLCCDGAWVAVAILSLNMFCIDSVGGSSCPTRDLTLPFHNETKLYLRTWQGEDLDITKEWKECLML
jgi:hypothetical protein